MTTPYGVAFSLANLQRAVVGASMLFGAGCSGTTDTTDPVILLAATDDTVEVMEDSSGTVVDVLRNDVGAAHATIASVSRAGHGSVAVTAGGLVFVPEANYCNDQPGGLPDHFTYTIDDGAVRATGSVLVTIACNIDRPRFFAGPDPTVTNQVDGQAQRYAHRAWATGITAGPAEPESFVFVVETDDLQMFTADDPPAISSTGELTFTPATDTAGVTSASVYLLQRGGRVLPGDAARSVVRTFTIATRFPLPVAADDASADYETAGSEGITVPAERGVLANDQVFTATLSGFGPITGSEQAIMGVPAATARGGTITLDSDGGFHYAPPANAVDLTSDSFAYQIANATGTATARVTIVLACGVGTCAGCCTAAGVCEGGGQDDACGRSGESCASCAAVSNTCRAGWCVNENLTDRGFVDDSSIHMGNAADAERMREDLIEWIWGSRGRPTNGPQTVVLDVASPVADVVGADRVDRLVIPMDYGVVASAYVHHPVWSNGKLLIWHQGHSSDLGIAGGRETIEAGLAIGYTVVAMWMPFYGENLVPAGIQTHAGIVGLPGPGGGIRFFVEPVHVVINWAQDEGFSEFSMIGLSGGGWTTALSAALDPRIRFSIPVAGTLPLYLWSPVEGGDEEQWNQPLYKIAGYLDLYALGALGEKRAQLQVINEFDSCCFWGRRHETYRSALRAAVSAIGPGSWDVALDSTHGDHMVSPYVLSDVVIPLLLTI